MENYTDWMTATMVWLLLVGVLGFWAYLQHVQLKECQRREATWLKRLDLARQMSLVGEISADQTLELIAKTTSLTPWWIDTHDPLITEEQVRQAPFWIDPHVASMAMSTRQPIHQHQMMHSDWAFAYIPKEKNGQLQGLLAVSSSIETQKQNQQTDEKWVEFLCAHWR